jgi:hypothetical protein
VRIQSLDFMLAKSYRTTLINIALKTIHIEKEVTQIDNGVEQLKQAITVSRTNDETVQALDRRNMIIDWLKTTDPSINHYAAMKKYQAGTGKWFVKGPYMGSLKKQNSLLWLYGIRKSFLAIN